MIQNETIDRCRRGDRSAQHEIYTQTAERVYRLLLRVTGNREDAFDLAQDTYIRAFTRIEQFDGRSSFETWLSRIAINQALQSRRRAALGRQAATSGDGQCRPDSATSAQDQRIDVEDALAQLPQSDRILLALRYQEGLDYAAIADLVGCPPGTVASRLNRARERVRELLKESYARPEENHRAGHPTMRGDTASPLPAVDSLSSRLRDGADS